ncbi:MAG: hypothetical protein AMJ79_00740 [Phycisphaerae bacterium SM23_30]|nr:MAG: hypothetical protein AMJ79_00740 [Phycisphaerae bacterium SM23_30]
MKQRKGLFSVAILALVLLVCGFGLTPNAQAADKIAVTILSPTFPAALVNNDHVTVSFKYTTDDLGGVRIWVIPYTKGSISPGAAWQGSALEPFPSGSSSRYFTITSDDVHVDQFRIYMKSNASGKLLFEDFIDVDYHFGNAIVNIVPSPSSPHGLLNEEYVLVDFDYSTNKVNGVRIWVLAYSGGVVNPDQWYYGSPIVYGSGSLTRGFTIPASAGDAFVDQFRIYMRDEDTGLTLWEKFVDVEYYFGNSITNINMVPASPSLLITGQDINITFDCATMDPLGAYVFARPYTNGVVTYDYAASGGDYFTGTDSGTQSFDINTDNQRIDQIRFYMYNNDKTVILVDFFVDVDYHISDSGSCIWYVDADAVGYETGRNWYHAFNDLQDALGAAWPGDQIWVAEGNYKPDQGVGFTSGDRNATFSLKNEVEIYGGFGGTESIRDERDWHAHETILSGEIGNGGMVTDNSFHVVYSASNDATAILDGFTISGGYNVGEAYPDYVGAGMLIMIGGEPTVSNCLFTDNDGGNGGGLGVWASSSPSLFNCIFMDNTASIAGGGVSLQHSNPVFVSCMFLGNISGGGGGLMALDNYAAPILTNCVFSGNSSAGYGGAIYNAGVGGNPNGFPPELQNCSLNENSAVFSGGGIHNAGGNDVVLNSCILWANTDAGGDDESAQFFDSSGAPTIEYSCLQGWTGGWGGPGNIGTDPMFVDPDGLDDILGNLDDNLRLQVTSPCIDTGDPNPLMNDSDGTRNDMGAYGGPGADLGGIGVIPGSGFLFTDVGNIPRSEITQDDLNPNLLQGTANVVGSGLGIPTYVNTAFGRSLWLHGLFGADNMDDIDYYQVLAGLWDGTTPPDPLEPGDWVTLDDKLVKVRWFYTTEWESEYVTIGPREIDGVEDLYLLTPTPTDDMWSRLTVRIIWNTRNYANGLYTLTVKAYREDPPGNLTDVTASLGDIAAGELILRIDNTPVTSIIHNVKYDPDNPYYIPADDGEIKECSIINLTDENENLRFTLTASHANGFLRQFTLDNIWGKNQNGGVIAQELYSNPPPLWNGVTNTEYQSQFAPDPPGNLQPWRRCAYQFRLRVWPRITNGFGYLGHSEFNDHYFLDLPGVLDCSVYDVDNNSFINMIDFAAFAQFWLKSCIIE